MQIHTKNYLFYPFSILFHYAFFFVYLTFQPYEIRAILTEEFAHASPVQFPVVQYTVRVCVKQLEDLSCPPLMLFDLVCAEQLDTEHLKLLVVERLFNFNIESRQYRFRKGPRIIIHHSLRHVTLYRASRLRYLRRCDDRTTVALRCL